MEEQNLGGGGRGRKPVPLIYILSAFYIREDKWDKFEKWRLGERKRPGMPS